MSDPHLPYAAPIKAGNKGPVRNTRSLKWPKMLDDDGRLSAAYREYSEDLAVCYRLVDIGSYITGKQLSLRAGGPRDGITKAATDGKQIFLPRMHPNRRVATKHELGHIFFKSNLALRLAFVRGMIKEFEGERGRPLAPHLKKQMTDDLCFFINILDDWRVNSLWGLIYPGDGRDMDEFYVGEIGPEMMRKALKTYADGDIDHLFTYAILLCLDQPAESSRWGEFEVDIIDTRDAVLWASFPTCLVACRRLVQKILRKVVEEQKEQDQKKSDQQGDSKPDPLAGLQVDKDQVRKDLGDVDDSDQDLSQTGPTLSIEDDIRSKLEEKAEGQRRDKALRDLFQGKKPNKDTFRSDNAGFDDNHAIPDVKADAPAIRTQVGRLLRLNAEDDDIFQEFQDDAVAAGTQQVQVIRKKLESRTAPRAPSESEFLKKSVKANLRIVKVQKHRLRAATLAPEDLEAAERWRRQVIRVMGALKNRMDYQGNRLSVPDLLRSRSLGIPLPCFRREVTGRGFEVLISVDMSSSMSGALFGEVERLTVILRKALNFPFVKLRIQGWSSKSGGQVTIYDYPPCRGNEGLVSPESQAGGVTPLSHAVQIAGQTMRLSRNERHVFLLSDGFPVYKLKGRRQFVQRGVLQEWTKDAVDELRKRRIRVWCWMIGRHVPKDEDMDFMFGPANWRKIQSDQIYTDGFDFLTQQFLTYLRTR